MQIWCSYQRAGNTRGGLLRRSVARVVLAGLVLLPVAAAAGPYPVYGPQTLTRSPGASSSDRQTFRVQSVATTFTLDVQAEGGAIGVVTLNGVQVVTARDFVGGRGHSQRVVRLAERNTIATEVKGPRGSRLTVAIHGIDDEPPVLTATPSVAPNARGWNRTPVTVTFACRDALSGIRQCPAPVTVASEGRNQTVSGTATDAAGNQTVATVTLNIDTTPPTITTVSPRPNAAGWHSAPVTVQFSCSDSGSGLATCPGDAIVNRSGRAQVVAGTAVDLAGNPASTALDVNLDSQPPVFAWVSPRAGAVVSTQTVTATGTATPPLSGIASATCNGQPAQVSGATFTCDVALSPGENLITGAITNLAGLTATMAIRVVYLATAPTISGFTPPAAAVGTLVTVTGANLAPNPTVTVRQAGGGTMEAPVSSTSPDVVVFVVPPGATSGVIDISVGPYGATSATPLTVVASSSFTVSAAPGAVTLVAGQSVAVAVDIQGAAGFSQLADLTVTGLPAGLSASFSPTRISTGHTSVLTLSADAAQPPPAADLTITAAANIDGVAVSQSAAVHVGVGAPTTSLLGRIVVADAREVPLSGVTVTMLGKNGNGGTTNCTGSTTSDAAGNFALAGLGAGCVGPQLVGYDGTTATSPVGEYAGVNLIYTFTAGQVTTSPVLVHLPRIDDKEKFFVQQNAPTDQTFNYQSIPGLTVTVYAGTTFRLQDGSTPNPFPLVAVQVPVDRLPDAKPPVPTMLSAFIVAFQPANAVASKPAAVTYPNTLDTAPGANMTMMTLDPTLGRMVPYGTATVSANGKQIVPDPDPAHPGARYGIVNFDWHGPMPGPAAVNPCKDKCDCPQCGDPVDLSSGLFVLRETDIAFGGGLGGLSLERTYRNMWNTANNGIDGAFGYGTSHNFAYRLNPRVDTLGLVMPDGNQLTFSKQPNNTYTNTTLPNLQGAVITETSPNIYDLRWPDGTVYNFGLESVGGRAVVALEKIIDANGNVTTLVRSGGRLNDVIDPAGRRLHFDYNGFVISQVTDPIGRTVKYSYTTGPGVTQVLRVVEYPDGTTVRYDYAANGASGNITLLTDQRGLPAASNTYDANDRVIQQVASDGSVTQFAYKLLNPLVPTSPVMETTVTDARGNQTVYRFTPEGLLVGVTDSLGQTRDLTRNGAGQVTAYAGTAQCSTCPPAQSGDQQFTYDSAGNMTSAVDALGHTTTYTYEATFNHVTSVTDALGNASTFGYDAHGNMTSQTDANGRVTIYKYDGRGLLIETTDATNAKTAFAYDSAGNLVAVTDALGNVTRFGYDGISRMTSVRDALGRETKTQYDAAGRVTRQTDALLQATLFAYDAAGSLVSLTDARGKATTFAYDLMNRLTTRTDPLGKADSRSYDQNGNLTGFVDRRGQASSFTYDALDRLVREQYADATVQRTYDGRQRLIQVTDSASGAFSFGYDVAGALVSSSSPVGSLKYVRDALGRQSRREVVGQSGVDYTYDPSGNLLSAAMPQASVSYTYDARNQPSRLSRANGVNTDYTFDPVGRVLSINHARGATSLASMGYTYDAAGNRVSQQTSSAQALVTPPAVATYDDANRILQRSGVTYAFDNNGNLVSEVGPNGTTTYSWDARDRLKTIATSMGQVTTLLYDFTGSLITQAEQGGTSATRNFVVDAMSNVALEWRSDGQSNAVLTGPSLDAHLAIVNSTGGVEYGLSDGTNSVTKTVDQGGTVRGQFMYEPFGKTTNTGTVYPFGYTGRVSISASIYYLRARYYSPLDGRFLSEDPVGFIDGGASGYAYVRNAPLALTDPTGMLWQEARAILTATVPRGPQWGSAAGAVVSVGAAAAVTYPLMVAVGDRTRALDGLAADLEDPARAAAAVEDLREADKRVVVAANVAAAGLSVPTSTGVKGLAISAGKMTVKFCKALWQRH